MVKKQKAKEDILFETKCMCLLRKYEEFMDYKGLPIPNFRIGSVGEDAKANIWYPMKKGQKFTITFKNNYSDLSTFFHEFTHLYDHYLTTQINEYAYSIQDKFSFFAEYHASLIAMRVTLGYKKNCKRNNFSLHDNTKYDNEDITVHEFMTLAYKTLKNRLVENKNIKNISAINLALIPAYYLGDFVAVAGCKEGIDECHKFNPERLLHDVFGKEYIDICTLLIKNGDTIITPEYIDWDMLKNIELQYLDVAIRFQNKLKNKEKE